MFIIKLVFTPFTKVDKKTYIGILVTWVLIFALFWQGAPTLWPTFSDILLALKEFLTGSLQTVSLNSFSFRIPSFFFDVLASFFLTVKSMLISIVIATILSYLYTIAFFKPLVQFMVRLRFMSLLGFLFVFMSLLHDANQVKVAILTFSIVPFFALSLVSMIDRIGQNEYDLWTTLRYSKWEQLYEIVVYGKADYVVEAIASNFAMAWLVMTVAEAKSMADGGLGVLLFKCDKFNQLDRIFALQIIIFAMGMLFDYSLKRLRYKMFPYKLLAEKKN